MGTHVIYCGKHKLLHPFWRTFWQYISKKAWKCSYSFIHRFILSNLFLYCSNLYFALVSFFSFKSFLLFGQECIHRCWQLFTCIALFLIKYFFVISVLQDYQFCPQSASDYSVWACGIPSAPGRWVGFFSPV